MTLWVVRQKQIISACISVFLAVSLLISCDYKPSGEDFHEIAIPTPQIDTVRLTPDLDTLRMAGNIHLIFDLPEEVTVYAFSIKLYVDTNLISQFYGWPIDANFDTSPFSDGYHKLEIQVISNSGSHSLADWTGNETFEYRKGWVLYTHNSPALPTPFETAEVTLKGTRLTWPKYDEPNFQQYVITKKGPPIDLTVTIFSTAVQDCTSWTDEEYVGGDYTYRLHVVASGVGASGPVSDIQDPFPLYLHTSLDGANIRVSWNRCLQDSAFGQYFLDFGPTPTGGSYTVSLTNINDTVYYDTTVTLGSPRYYLLQVQPKVSYGSYLTNQLYIQTTMGHGLPAFNTIRSVPSTGITYFVTGDEVRATQTTDHNLLNVAHFLRQQPEINNLDIGFDISANGQYAFATNGNDLARIDPVSLATIDSLKIRDIIGREAIPFAIAVSGNGVLAVQTIEAQSPFTLSPGLIILYDYANGQFLDTLQAPFYTAEMAISDDGTAFTLYNNLYQFKNDSISLVMYSPYAPLLEFVSGSPELLESENAHPDYYLNVRSLSDNSIIRRINLPDLGLFQQYDPLTGLTGISIPGKNLYQVYDHQSGNLVWSQSGTSNSWLFVNGRLYDKSGIWLQIIP